VAADKTDQPGVLGNLPRSRPGQRSEKRGGARPAATAAAAKRKPASASKRKATRKPASSARKPAARKPPTAAHPRERAAAQPRERRAPQPAASSPDPLTFALRTAGKVAEVGLKTAGGILRRIPGR
jgi:hypothetical protein